MTFNLTKKGEKAMVKSRKQVSLILCLALTTTIFTGCGKKGSDTSDSNSSADYDHIFKEEEFELSEEVNSESLYSMTGYGDYVVSYGSTYNEKADASNYVIIRFKNDGSDVKQIEINGMPESGEGSVYISDVKCDAEGNVYVLKDEYSYSEDSDGFDIYYLDKYDTDGELEYEAVVSENGANESFSGIFYMEGKGILAYGNGIVSLFSDSDGSFVNKFDTGLDYFQEVIPKDDKLYIYYWEEEGYKFKEFSLTDGKMGGDVSFPGSLSNYISCYPGTATDLLLLANTGIYTYNFGDSDVTYSCSYIDSDINPDNVSGAVQVSDTEYIILVMNDENAEYEFKKIVKVPAEEAKSQEVITLGCYWMDYNIRSAIIDFNKTNPKYRISVKDYSMYDTDTDYSAGVTKLNTDIVGGNVPDIIIASTEMPMESYISKGLFMDLDPIIEADSEFVMDDYLTNVIDSFRRDGKLYSLVPGFSLYTVAAATSDLGGKTSWTISDMKQIADSKGIAYKDLFGPGYARDSVMTMAIYLNASSYIDWDKHECKFDSEEFKEFLAFLKEFPSEIDNSVYSIDYSDYWRKDKALAELMYMSSFNEYQMSLRGTFGEDVTLIGLPTDGASGSAIIPDNELCISASTSKEEGCWEFIKSLFTEDFQKEVAEYSGFPVKKSVFEDLADEAMKPSTWVNEDGEEETYTQTTYIGGKDIEVTPLTREERDYVVGFIESLSAHVVYDEEILNIVTEEAAAYFNDQKTVDDVVSIIQSRISIYVNENS